MTNRQIAQSLFVTVKTVEAHLSAAYDKLDIGSRGQLPGALGRRPSAPRGRFVSGVLLRVFRRLSR